MTWKVLQKNNFVCFCADVIVYGKPTTIKTDLKTVFLDAIFDAIVFSIWSNFLPFLWKFEWIHTFADNWYIKTSTYSSQTQKRNFPWLNFDAHKTIEN